MTQVMLIDVLNQCQYREYVITGGEPLSNWDRTEYIVDGILSYHYNNDHVNFVPKIYLYTSILIDEMVDVARKFDGITYSLHEPFEDIDVSEFIAFQSLVQFFPKKQFWLNIDSTIEETVGIIPGRWDRINVFKPKENCPVPEGEDLFRLMEVL